jgi:hypothetical protein
VGAKVKGIADLRAELDELRGEEGELRRISGHRTRSATVGRLEAGLDAAAAALEERMWRAVFKTAMNGAATPSPAELCEIAALRLVVQQADELRAAFAAVVDAPPPRGMPDPFVGDEGPARRREVRDKIQALEAEIEILLAEHEVDAARSRRDAVAGRG